MAKEPHPRMIATVVALAISLVACSPSISKDEACRAQLPTWARPLDDIPHLAVVNKITLSPGGEIRWNGVTITEAQLESYLREIRGAPTLPFTIFDPDPTSDCAKVRRIRQLIDTSLSCNQGRCGEGRNWTHASGLR